MMQIHLIRHGKTMANQQKLYCGSTDIPLSEAGVAELANLREQGIYPIPASGSVFFTSGLLRTQQTLDILYGPVKRETLPQLAEFKFGNFEMHSYEELKNQDDYQAWITDETGAISCPGGECRQSFTRRVLTGFEILSSQDNDTFAVCHGGTITCIMEHLFPGIRNFYEWQPKPGHGYTIIYTPGEIKQYEAIGGHSHDKN